MVVLYPEVVVSFAMFQKHKLYFGLLVRELIGVVTVAVAVVIANGSEGENRIYISSLFSVRICECY